jgi:hypothetical protein
MKPYRNFMGKMVDLDSPMVCGKKLAYAAWGTVHLECIRELGYALVYLEYLQPAKRQLGRVKKLCRELAASERMGSMDNGAAGRNPDVQYWKGFLYRIWDETENLC